VATQFEVAPSTAVRVQSRFAATGPVEPARLGRPKGSGKLAPPYTQAILGKVKAGQALHGDRALPQINRSGR